MTSFKVLAPYVTLKVKDLNGQPVIQGFLAEGIVKDPVEDAAFEKHVRTRLIEALEDAETEPAPVPAQVEKPAGNASQEVWAAFAVTQGAEAEEVKDLSRDDLRELYG